jgi:hypothetical protein
MKQIVLAIFLALIGVTGLYLHQDHRDLPEPNSAAQDADPAATDDHRHLFHADVTYWESRG